MNSYQSAAFLKDEDTSPPQLFGAGEFSEEEAKRIQKVLEMGLSKDKIAQRPGPGGQKISYLRQTDQIEIANAIFGFNGWSCQVLQLDVDFCDQDERTGKWNVGATAIVRVQLKDGCFHEDVGDGKGLDRNKMDALGKAKKSAVTDARKRALSRFGEHIGNSIYNKEHIKQARMGKVETQSYHIQSDINAEKENIGSFANELSAHSSGMPSNGPVRYYASFDDLADGREWTVQANNASNAYAPGFNPAQSKNANGMVSSDVANEGKVLQSRSPPENHSAAGRVQHCQQQDASLCLPSRPSERQPYKNPMMRMTPNYGQNQGGNLQFQAPSSHHINAVSLGRGKDAASEKEIRGNNIAQKEDQMTLAVNQNHSLETEEIFLTQDISNCPELLNLMEKAEKQIDERNNSQGDLKRSRHSY